MMIIGCSIPPEAKALDFDPFPGSEKALILGCTCPEQRWWPEQLRFESECPVHELSAMTPAQAIALAITVHAGDLVERPIDIAESELVAQAIALAGYVIIPKSATHPQHESIKQDAEMESGPGELVAENRRLRRALYMSAASCQGGHSGAGRAIAEIFGIDFPIRMKVLVGRAKADGFDPVDLWPWWEKQRLGAGLPSLTEI